jgi:hypothetical protein
LHGPVIIAMITVRMVQPAVYKIVDMVTMRHRFMSAVWTVRVLAMDLRRALHGICGIYRDGMFVHVILVHMVEMAVVKIIHMSVMTEPRCARNPGHAYECGWRGVSRYMWPLAILLVLVCHRYLINADNSGIVAEANDA